MRPPFLRMCCFNKNGKCPLISTVRHLRKMSRAVLVCVLRCGGTITPSCTKQWTLGQATSIVFKHTVCVNIMPRHERDVRQRRYDNDRDTGHVSHGLVSDN